MKDLYTFDITREAAIDAYQEVQVAYADIFAALGIPILVAEASSGDMGGELSHEYHLPSRSGEDVVVKCDSCAYTANDEVADSRRRAVNRSHRQEGQIVHVWRGVSKDRQTLVNAWYSLPSSSVKADTHAEGPHDDRGVSVHAVKAFLPDLDTGLEDPTAVWSDILSGQGISSDSPRIKVLNLVDSSLPPLGLEELAVSRGSASIIPDGMELPAGAECSVISSVADSRLNLLTIRHGDACPRCEGGTLNLHRALELGHTFHLGTRYSQPLGASVVIPAGKHPLGATDIDTEAAIQMGCHGLGLSRIIGAVAEYLADSRGLIWPRAIAPWEAVIISSDSTLHRQSLEVYDTLASANTTTGEGLIDCVLDDRGESLVRKMKDADLIGYPVVVIVGRAWRERGVCEVQCRRLGVKRYVPLSELRRVVEDLLASL